MIIIGITGTLGAGKGTIVDYLTNEWGFAHYSVRGYLFEVINKRGLPMNRDSLVMVANELRASNSPSFITDELYFQAEKTGRNAVIESIRTPGEIASLRQKGRFYLFAVDADSRTRYERIYLRASETDQISYETFLSNEAREFESQDPNKQNLKACIQQADYTFNNDGSIEDLHLKVSTVLESIQSASG
jgi:dephospho-CoA kinase